MAGSTPISAKLLHEIICGHVEEQESRQDGKPSQRCGFHIVTYFKGELAVMPGGNVSSDDIKSALEGAGIQFEILERGLIKLQIKQA